MTAMIPAIGEALLHVGHIQRDLVINLRLNNQNWEKSCPMSIQSLKKLDWWKNQASQLNGLPIILKEVKEPDVEIFVDVSDTGWGVTSTHVETAGHWKRQESDLSINLRELKPILFALQLHAKEYEGGVIKIYSDNVTALKYAKKSGGTVSLFLQELALEIQEVTATYNLQVRYQHIQGIKNVQADALSRKKKPLYEWKLLRRFFKKIQEQWRPLKINAFATRANTRLRRFWGLNPDPQAEATNAWRQRWLKTGIYLHSPWKLIPKALRKLKADRVKTAVLITPSWQSQFWWPMVLHQSIAKPLTFKVNKLWSLTAWKLSGRINYR